MMFKPRFEVGETRYWYCDIEQRTHKGFVNFVNFVHIGEYYKDINYEVESLCCGETKILFIDECETMAE